jgi:hypothetical protein
MNFKNKMFVQNHKYCIATTLKQQQFSWNRHTHTHDKQQCRRRRRKRQRRRRRIKMRRKINEDKAQMIVNA